MQPLEQNGLTMPLRIGLSRKKGINQSAPGIGLFAGSQRHKRKVTVFKRGDDVIPRISGAMAMRVHGMDGKFRDWLVDGHSFAGLDSDSNVIWSAVDVPVQLRSPAGELLERKVELGCRPDDYALYSNHSAEPNTAVLSSLNKAPGDEDNSKSLLASLPVTEDSVTHQLVAEKTILSGDEITWSYAPSPDFSGKTYREPFCSRTDSSWARQSITALTGRKSGHLKEKSSTHLLEERWQRKFKPARRHYQLSTKETLIREKYSIRQDRFSLKKALTVCNRSKKKQDEVMITYLKIRLEAGGDLVDVLDSVSTVLRKIPAAIGLVSGKERCLLADIYQYCYEKGLINPQDEPYSVPLEWLVRQIRGASGKNRSKWYLLLVNRLRAVLVFPGCGRFALLKNLHTVGMPNPLREGRPEWSLCDLESLTGFTSYKEPDEHELKKDIELYLNGTSCEIRSVCKKIAELARRGRVNAIKAMVIRRLSGKTTRTELVEEFNTTEISLVIGGENCPANPENLIKFIREHFSSTEREQIRGYWWCTDDELLACLERKKKMATSINSEICSRIRNGNRRLLRPFIQSAVGNGKTHRSAILKNLKDAQIFAKGKTHFTAETLLPYLKPEQQELYSRISIRKLS